jgi:hypothetical protein
VGERSLENRYYKITWDADGKIIHLWDKELGRDWADQLAAHGINQLVVRAVESGETHVPGQMRAKPGQAGPVYASVILSGQALGCPQLAQEIILYDQLKRVDFANRLLKDATPFLELYFAFPLAMNKPQFRYEASQGVIAPILDQLPGTNTDAYAMQHWAAAWDGKGGVAWASLESPVVELGGLWPGYVSQAHHGLTTKGYGHEFLRDPGQLEKGHIYSYAMDNNFRTNFQPAQVADALFRYSLTSYSGDYLDGRASDFGWGVSSALSPVVMSGPQYSTLAPATSFCQVDAPNVRLLTIKAAEDGDGLILRLAESEGREVETLIKLPFLEIKEVVKANLVEEGEEAVSLAFDRRSFRVKLTPHAVITLRCRSIRKWPTVGFLARF